jgi:hypothetical protein
MATANVVQTSISGGHSNALAIQGDGAFLPKLDTASRLALTLGTPDKGLMVYDTTLTTICVWNGVVWEFISDNSNGFVSVKDFGAKGDGITDDTAAFTASMTFAAANGNLYVYVPAGIYVVSSTVSVPSYCGFFGTGGSEIRFTGAGVCFYCGTVTAASYKMAIRDLRIILIAITSTAIQLDNSILSEVKDVYIEGPLSNLSTRTNVGVLITGDQIDNFFNSIQNVDCNHVHIGYKVLRASNTSPSWPTIQEFINCSSLGDKIYGDLTSAGFYFEGGQAGCDSVITGGNVESCGTGVKCVGAVGQQTGALLSLGLRFEGNTVDIAFDGGVGHSFTSATLSYSKITGTSISSNYLQVKDDPAVTGIMGLGPLFLNSFSNVRWSVDGSLSRNFYLSQNNGGSVTNAYTGSMRFQAGSGSATWGGSFELFGGSHATLPGGVGVGLADTTSQFVISNGFPFSGSFYWRYSANARQMSMLSAGALPAVAPGAGFGSLRWETGTTPGTLKLVAYGNASVVGVTIVDNVG